MSWLKPENIPTSGYDPEKSVEGMAKQHGELSRQVLDAFNEVDPLQVYFENNIDEYKGYAERFIQQLSGWDIKTLSDEEISNAVRGAFHKSQIEQGFVESKDLDVLVQRIIQLKVQV